MTFGGPNHSFVGDVVAVLIAPNGASHTVFGRTLATTATAFGGSSDLAGPYVFSDVAPAPPSGGWWQQAGTTPATMAAGTYRTTASGGAGAVNPQPPTTMNTAFSGVANPNGNWVLRLTDGCASDTGAIAAATLSITAGATVGDAAVDFNGDGRSDYAVIRTGAGPVGQAVWFINPSSGGPVSGYAWGLASDFFVPEDYDGDHKDDIAIWRPGAATQAAFYILNSATSTVRIEAFGQTGDDPSVVGDYTNDGIADLAVYRVGDTPSSPSTWYYRAVANGPTTVINWGLGGDTAAPGDYNGDGKNDFAIQRVSGAFGVFWIAHNGLGTFTAEQFGLATDLITPGDYDGDGKTDLAVARGSSGSGIVWYWKQSSNGFVQQIPFGRFDTDWTVQGDYDGDGKTDQAIWRETDGVFWIRNVATGAVNTFQFGSNGDYPVGNFTTH